MEELCNISERRLMQEAKAFRLIPDLETKAEFVSRKCVESIKSYHSKPLHGYHPQVCEDLLDRKLSFLWLFKGFLTGETEGLLIAAQDQAF